MATRVVVLGAGFGRLVNFLGGPKPTGTFQAPSEALAAEKVHFRTSRLQRWFGRVKE